MNYLIGFVVGFVSFPLAWFGVKEGYQVIKKMGYYLWDKIRGLKSGA
jgi:hypothetical protein